MILRVIVIDIVMEESREKIYPTMERVRVFQPTEESMRYIFMDTHFFFPVSTRSIDSLDTREDTDETRCGSNEFEKDRNELMRVSGRMVCRTSSNEVTCVEVY